MIGTEKPDRRFCAGEHIEHLGLMGVQIDLPERLPAHSWRWIDCDMLHSAHAEVAGFLQVF